MFLLVLLHKKWKQSNSYSLSGADITADLRSIELHKNRMSNDEMHMQNLGGLDGGIVP